MAAIRILAIGAFHQAGYHRTAEASRWAIRSIGRPLRHPRTQFTIVKRPWVPAGIGRIVK